jgi:hypothetical protein
VGDANERSMPLSRLHFWRGSGCHAGRIAHGGMEIHAISWAGFLLLFLPNHLLAAR